MLFKLNSKVVVGGPITAHTRNRETEELGGFWSGVKLGALALKYVCGIPEEYYEYYGT